MYSYFDAHCDTMSKIYKNSVGLDSDTLMVNTKNLGEFKNAVQVFALFNGGTMNKSEMLRCFSLFKSECQRLSHVARICTSSAQIDENTCPLSAILAIEGLGNQPDFTPADIKDYCDTGVRFMGLCWNNDNPLGGGCDGEAGLTALADKVCDAVGGIGKSGLDIVLTPTVFPVICPVVIPPCDVAAKKRTEYLKLGCSAAKDYSDEIKQVTGSLAVSDKNVLVANSDGVYGEDRRAYVRIMISAIASNGRENQNGRRLCSGISFH